MSDEGGWKAAARTHMERIREAVKGLATANPFFGGVIRSRGPAKGRGGSGRNPFFGGRGTAGDAYGDAHEIGVGYVPRAARPSGRRWSGSTTRRPGPGSMDAARRAGLVVVKFGARTLNQSLGSTTPLFPSSAVARLKARMIKGMSRSMSGLPGLTVATHNGVRNHNGPKKR
ncbi:hypothetical protein HYY27_08740 [bacterium]|nr:hypothetical protein [bacterium]